MNWKTKDSRPTTPTTNAAPSSKLSFDGGGKVSVSVNSIVNSPKVQRQVDSVREIAASQGKK
jgi:hypothetical protein